MNMSREIFIISNTGDREVVFPADDASSFVGFIAGKGYIGRHLPSVFTSSYDSDGLLTSATKAELIEAIRLWFANISMPFSENGDCFTYDA
jgi:hypothetical protein